MFCMLNCINFLIAKIKMESWKIKKKYFISCGWHCIENSLTLAIFPDLDLFSRRCVCRTPIGGETLMVSSKCDLKNVKLLIVEEKIPRQNKNQTINKIFGRRFPHTIFWRFTYTTKGCVGYWRTRMVAKNKVFSLIHILKTLINFFS